MLRINLSLPAPSYWQTFPTRITNQTGSSNALSQSGPHTDNDQLHLSTKSKALHFSGAQATRQLREGSVNKFSSMPWGAGKTEKIVTEDDTPYVGDIPEPLLAKSKITEPAFFQELDKVASHLNEANYWKETFAKPISTTFKVGELSLKVKKLKEGYFNKAYRISDGENSYVLKIHKDAQKNPIKRIRMDDETFQRPDHSIYHDVGLAAFLTHHEIYKDVARFHAANPNNPKAGWLLEENILATAKVSERDGKALYSDVKAWVEDDCKDNRVGYKGKDEPGILCDFGGTWILSIPRSKPASKP